MKIGVEEELKYKRKFYFVWLVGRIKVFVIFLFKKFLLVLKYWNKKIYVFWW